MIEREKIKELVRKCAEPDSDFGIDNAITFYHAAQADAFEQAAKVCEYMPVGCGLEGRTFADAIRQLGKEMK